MKALILWSDPRSTNLGVQALAAGAKAMCERVWGPVEVSHASYGFRQVPIRLWNHRELGLELLTKRRGFAEWMSQFDIILDTRAGDSFADIYGLDRHAAMTLVGEVARQSRTPLVMVPQTIGPFGGRASRLMARRALAKASVVMARDATSADVARQLGRKDVVTATDVVFALTQPPRSARYDVLLNVSGLLWKPNPHCDHEEYRATVHAVARGLRTEGRRITLLSHVLESDDHDKDTPACRELAGELGEDLEILVPTGLEHVRELVAGAELVIGSRMHACLNALSVGTPAIALAYSRKFAPLMSDVGWPATLDLTADTDLAARVLETAREPDLASGVARTLTVARKRLEACDDALRSAV